MGNSQSKQTRTSGQFRYEQERLSGRSRTFPDTKQFPFPNDDQVHGLVPRTKEENTFFHAHLSWKRRKRTNMDNVITMKQAIDSVEGAPNPIKRARPPGYYPKFYRKDGLYTSKRPLYEYVAKQEEPYWDHRSKRSDEGENSDPGLFRLITDDHGQPKTVLAHPDGNKTHRMTFYHPKKYIIGSSKAPSKLRADYDPKQMQPQPIQKQQRPTILRRTFTDPELSLGDSALNLKDLLLSPMDSGVNLTDLALNSDSLVIPRKRKTESHAPSSRSKSKRKRDRQRAQKEKHKI